MREELIAKREIYFMRVDAQFVKRMTRKELRRMERESMLEKVLVQFLNGQKSM